MSQRLDYLSAAPNTMQLLFKQEAHITQQFKSDEMLSLSLLTLIKLRVSQINQCGFCIDMHNKEAIIEGETMERLVSLVSWPVMPCYNEREKVALRWSEALINKEAISDEQYNKTLAQFGESGLVEITVAVNAINSWNTIARSFLPAVGSYTS